MNENLIAVKRVKKVLTLNKPCYVGMCILDISTTLVYDFHYNTIKKEYGDNANLLFTDTDSLMYEIKTDDVYKDFKRIGDKRIVGTTQITLRIALITFFFYLFNFAN
jgi:hypothetical protein